MKLKKKDTALLDRLQAIVEEAGYQTYLILLSTEPEEEEEKRVKPHQVGMLKGSETHIAHMMHATMDDKENSYLKHEFEAIRVLKRARKEALLVVK